MSAVVAAGMGLIEGWVGGSSCRAGRPDIKAKRWVSR
jgi:hypothetical protein